MTTLTTGMLIVLLFTGAITALAMLSVFSNIIGHETQLHDLRNRVKELHFQHAMYLARLNAQIPEEETQAPVQPTQEPFAQMAQELPDESLESPPIANAQSLPLESNAPVAAAA